MKVLAIGPYIGDFENELLQFRPYARWLTEAIKWDKVYLSTHVNRLFLYDFVPEENIIPVYQHFSRDEENQQGYIHKKVDKKDYRLILKTFKDKILEKENCNRKDIEIHHFSYTKNSQPYSIYKKIFNEIPDITLKIPKEHENKIIFIPAKTESLEKLAYIYQWLKNNYDIIVVGSTDTWFSNDNVILDKIDYFENGWKYIIQYISKAKGIICPLSYWTGLSNMQSKSIFSWGDNPGQYRYDPNAVYNFGNKKASIIPADENTSPNIIIRSMENFIKEMK